ncbi:MAG: hypothetical protein ACLGIR_05105 [Actinomycetes bacterium]
MRTRTRLRTVLAATAGAVVLAAGPAAADAPGPTSYVSTITSTPDGLEAEVIGGDSYLTLRVPDGTEVVVPGYDEDELYLRFNTDGTVEVNTNAVAFYFSQGRYGAEVPPDLQPGSVPPTWVLVAEDGAYSWHDHRIHWMSPTPPDFIDPGATEVQPVYDWEIPLLVDGEPVAITGDLAYLPAASPVPGLLALLVTAGAAVALLRARPGLGGPVALAAGVLTLAAISTSLFGLPPGVDGNTVLALPAAAGALLALIGLRGGTARSRSQLPVAAALGTVGTGVLTLGWLSAPVLPTSIDPAVVRPLLGAGVGLALAVLVGAALTRTAGAQDQGGVGTAPTT